MKTLLTAHQVLDLAFAAGEHLPPEALTRAMIAAAEERYVRPLVGDSLYQDLLAGAHEAFSADYIRPLAALGVKRLLLPQLKLRPALCGVVEPKAQGWQAASEESLEAADRALALEIEALSRRLHKELERRHAEGELEAYRPEENIRNRCRNHGGLFQIL